MRKNLHRSMMKINIPICIAAVLLCMTLFSTYFVSGLYARYTSSEQAGDSARVAVFSVKGGGDVLTKPIAAELVPGEIESATLIIENNSEVAVDYTIEVKNKTENLPLNFELKKGDTSLNRDANFIEVQDSAIAGKSDNTYVLYIEWASHGEEEDLARIGEVDQITVTVTATQAD